MSTTYSFTNGSGGSWDAASNWTPSTVTYNGFGQTTFADSFVLGNIDDLPYVATFADNQDTFQNYSDQVDALTIDYSGVTLTQLGGGFLYVQNSISLIAGTIDLGYGGGISFTQPATGTFLVDGILEGSGAILGDDPAITGDGTIIATAQTYGTSLDVAAAVEAGLTMQVQSGAVLGVDTVAQGVNIAIENSTNGVVELDTPGGFGGSISGLGVGHGRDNNPGSFIELPNVGTAAGDRITLTGAPIINNTITLEYGIQTFGTIQLTGRNYNGDYVNWIPDAAQNTTYLFLTDTPVCYAAGTRILTPAGYVRVETLSAGDEVVTVEDGRHVPQAVKWMGHRRIRLDQHPNGPELAPIRISRGALADGLPSRDLLVSPPHCLHIDGKLIPAKLLVNGMTITRETTARTVEYHHVELDRHSVIVAEGVEAESYLDTGNRPFFSNAGVAMILHPEFQINASLRCWNEDAIAPLVVSPDAIRPAWARFADRAIALGCSSPEHRTTTDADIHLMANGRRIDAVSVKGQCHTFVLQPGSGPVELMSRAVVPSILVPYLDDPREIGVSVRRIVVRDLYDRVEYAADHPALVHAWHEPERLGSAIWRWTKGRAQLPVEQTRPHAFIVEITVAETTTYILNAAEPPLAERAIA